MLAGIAVAVLELLRVLSFALYMWLYGSSFALGCLVGGVLQMS